MCLWIYSHRQNGYLCTIPERNPDFDSLLQSLKNRTMRHTDTEDNASDDELLVGYVDSKIAEEKVRESYRIIDVRTLPEYEADHIPNAIHIPLDDLNNRHPEVRPSQRTIICLPNRNEKLRQEQNSLHQ